MKARKTIKLQGKDYVQVVERIRAIHEERKDTFDVLTEYTITENGNIVFTASIIVTNKSGTHTYRAHSLGKLGGAKAFE